MSGAAVAADDVGDAKQQDAKQQAAKRAIIRGGEKPVSTLSVARMSTEQQCEFADIVCIDGSSDPVFVARALEDIMALDAQEPLESTFCRWNPTSIGNFAFMSQYVASPLDRAVFRHVLERYIRWRESQEFRFWLCAGIGTVFLLATLIFRPW